jgi:hypothetical protein
VALHTLEVIKEALGWRVSLGVGATSHFRTRAQAIYEAERMCHDLRLHGEEAETVVADEPEEAATRPPR